MNTLLCAIDPGASGGIAWIEPGKGVQAVKMPDTDEGVLLLARTIAELGRLAFIGSNPPHLTCSVKVYIEEVGGYVKPPKIVPARYDVDGQQIGNDVKIVGGQPGSAMFRFGDNYGFVRAAFMAMGAEVILVRPQVWQAMLFTKKGQAEKAEWKRTLKGFAQRFFPWIKVTLATADALCILRHAMNLAGLPRVENAGTVPPMSQRKGGTASVLEALANLSEGPNSCRRESRYVITGQTGVEAVELSGSKTAEPERKADSANPGSGAGLFLGDWKGNRWVFRKWPGGSVSLVRRAQGEDLTLPALK